MNVADLRLAAEKRMHRMCFGYLDSGADDEVTLRRSKDAFLEKEIHYRVLPGTNPETLDLSARVLGEDLGLPFFPCPCAGQRMFHNEGEVAVAAAASARRALYSLSTLSTARAESCPSGLARYSLQEEKASSPTLQKRPRSRPSRGRARRSTSTPEQIAAGGSADAPKLFQLYVWKDRRLVARMLDLAADAGFSAIVPTRRGNQPSEGLRAPDLPGDGSQRRRGVPRGYSAESGAVPDDPGDGSQHRRGVESGDRPSRGLPRRR